MPQRRSARLSDKSNKSRNKSRKKKAAPAKERPAKRQRQCDIITIRINDINAFTKLFKVSGVVSSISTEKLSNKHGKYITIKIFDFNAQSTNDYDSFIIHNYGVNMTYALSLKRGDWIQYTINILCAFKKTNPTTCHFFGVIKADIKTKAFKKTNETI